MGEQGYLGEFELMVLLAIVHLGDEAYGVPLAKELEARRGGRVALGSVYAALERLEGKGLVTSTLGEATPERGGRAKRYFRVTEKGMKAIQTTRAVLSKLWQAVPFSTEEIA